MRCVGFVSWGYWGYDGSFSDWGYVCQPKGIGALLKELGIYEPIFSAQMVVAISFRTWLSLASGDKKQV